MKYSFIPVSGLLLVAACTPIFSESPASGNACLIGTWTPDFVSLKQRLIAMDDAPNVEFSGGLSMVIDSVNTSDGVEFRADNWTWRRTFPVDPDSELVVNGAAKFSLSAPTGGEFHFAEQSNTYTQTFTLNFKGGHVAEQQTETFKGMLPIGEWAHGNWSCAGDTIQFEVTDQDPDSQLVETWYRQ